MVLAGQGEIHLKVAVEKLKSKYGLKLNTHPAAVPYKETIRKSVTQRGRHKRQSGGHGQFGDCVIEIKPQPRGAGFIFVDEIVGGVVPKQFIPSVEKGVIEYLKSGPLGFPVVDICVTLNDGSYHTVNSSDAAFQTAARVGMQEGMPQCSPVLLEPIMHVRIHVPSEATAKVNAVVSGRRGQLLGFDVRAGWNGWDTVGSRDAAIGTRQSHHRASLADARRGHLRDDVRPSGRTHRQGRGPNRGGAQSGQGRGEGVVTKANGE